MPRFQAGATITRAALLAAFTLIAGSCTPKPETAANAHGPDSAHSAAGAMTPVQRGEYLAIVSGCHDCHTPGGLWGAPDFSRALAGSDVGWQGPWGVTYAKNLTPDAVTGLGTWTEDEIIRALQSGVRKNGAPIGPPMPWPNFARYTREDVTAIVAYLKSLPAVSHQVPANTAPGARSAGPVISVPAPSAWDAPKTPAS
jgi:mono/diheme cytochrome c family protein